MKSKWSVSLLLFIVLFLAASFTIIGACDDDDDGDDDDSVAPDDDDTDDDDTDDDDEDDDDVDDDDTDDDDADDDDDDDLDGLWNQKQCPEDPGAYVSCMDDSKGCGTQVGDVMYNFSKKDVDGNCVELYDFLGDVLFMDAFGMWCGPCQDGTPILQTAFQDVYHQHGFNVIQLMGSDRSQSTPYRPDLVDWTTTYGMTFPVVADRLPSVGNAINDSGYIPFYWLVDQNMVIVAKIVYPPKGQKDAPGSMNDFHPLIQDLLGLQ